VIDTHLVIGRSERSWYKSWFGPSFLDRLVKALPDVTIVIVGAS